MKIKFSEVMPPIPTRDFDYCAFIEGQEELQQYGWGSTPLAAVEDLKLKFEEGFYIMPIGSSRPEGGGE